MKKILLYMFIFMAFFINVKAEEEFLTNLLIDGKTITGFASDKDYYELTVDSTKDKITLGYEYNTNVYQGVGSIGPLELKYGDNNYEYTLNNKEDATISKTYKIKVTRPDTRNTDNSLSSLIIGGQKVVLGDTNEYNVSVDGKVSSVEIKATLNNNKASFVDGYGERTGKNAIQLSNEKTSVEVKVKAENENVRTYTINITKVNMISNDATLKSLKIDGVEFEFKSNTFEYNLSVKNDISKIKINVVKNNEKANVEYQETVMLKTGINNIEIKVTAEDKSVKVYKLNITREEEVPVVKDIKITGVDFEFEPKTYNYKIETTLTKLDFNITLNSETAKSEIIDNENLENGSSVKIKVTDGTENITYTFKIINREDSNQDTIATGTNSDNSLNSFLKENELLVSLIIFGIGVFGTLAAILLRKKKDVKTTV